MNDNEKLTDDEREALVKRLEDEVEYRVRTAVTLAKCRGATPSHRVNRPTRRCSRRSSASSRETARTRSTSRQPRTCTVTSFGC